jgi:formylglycine-generating enzyme required for sulfatase activity
MKNPSIANKKAKLSSDSFYISKYLLTQEKWTQLMKPKDRYFSGLNLPECNINWFEAIEYCNRLSLKEGLTPAYSYDDYGTDPDRWEKGWNEMDENHLNISVNWTANGFRIPRETEWEFAARGGVKSKGYIYSGGDILDEVAWYGKNSDSKIQPVGMKKPNELGIYDMSGLLWEWCWGYFNRKNPTSDTYISDSPVYKMVVRGGSFLIEHFLNVGSRYPSTIFPFIPTGLRICRNVL